ncbi:unnamed protein product [Trichobilharzia regenti]|nr:unnamed protein product [Trichobilharzia regenti]
MGDWTNVWPAAATFHHAVVPFPVRQGHCKNLAENGGIPPEKYANFCTVWPLGLNCDETIEKHYPVEIINRSYVFTSSNIRDPRSRVVTLQVSAFIIFYKLLIYRQLLLTYRQYQVVCLFLQDEVASLMPNLSSLPALFLA